MKRVLILALGLILFPSVAMARPYPDRIAPCYVFENDQKQKVLPCVVSTGYGSGEHYTALTWPDGSELVYREDSQSHMGSLNDQPAKSYQRDATFYEVIKSPQQHPDDGIVTCLTQLKSTTSYCYQNQK